MEAAAVLVEIASRAMVGSRNCREGERVMLKKAAVVGIAGLMLGASPAAAASIGDAETVALTMIGGGGLLSIGCLATTLLTEKVEEGYDRRGVYLALSGGYARENFTDSSVFNLFDGEIRDNLQTFRETPDLGDPDASPPEPPGDPGIYSLAYGGGLDDDTFGITGRGGYRCHPFFSTELQFEWLDDFDGGSIQETGTTPGADWPDQPDDTLRNYEFKLETLVFTTNVKGHLMTGRYQPFVLAGLGFMRMETKARDITPNDEATTAQCPRPSGGAPPEPCHAPQVSDRRVEVAMRFGAGLDFYMTENVLISAEGSYLMPTGKLNGLDYYVFSLGLQYRF
jgi:opacity protein-like surface antigen